MKFSEGMCAAIFVTQLSSYQWLQQWISVVAVSAAFGVFLHFVSGTPQSLVVWKLISFIGLGFYRFKANSNEFYQDKKIKLSKSLITGH